MAVAFDTASAAQSLSNQNSKSWSHTASGSDRLGVVALAFSTDTITVSSITWGGTPMTLIGTATLAAWHKAALYCIVAPPTSSATVAVTFSGNAYGAVASMSFTGVDQTTPAGTPVTNTNASAASTSVNVSSTTGDMVIDCIKHYPNPSGTGEPTVGASQTSRWAGDDGSFNENGASSTETGSGTIAMSWTGVAGTDAWAHIAVNLLQAAAGAGTGSPADFAVPVTIPQAVATTTNPYVVEWANNAVATNDPSLTFSSVATDDVIVMWCSHGTVGQTLTIPSGWTNVLGGTTDVESDSHQMACVMHTVTSGEAGSSVTFTATDLYSGTTINVVGAQVRNADATMDIAASTFNSGNTITPHVLAGLTPTVSGGLMLSAVSKDGTGSHTTPTGWTIGTTRTAAAPVMWAGKYDTYTTASAAIGATNITPSAGDEYASISLVLKQAATGGATATPAAFAVPVALDAATVQAGSSITPTAFAVPVAFDAVTASAASGATPTPAAFAVPVTIDAATAVPTHTATPAVFAVPVNFDTAAAYQDATGEPVTFAIPVTFDAPTATGAGNATPAAFAVPVAFSAATIVAGASSTPAAFSVQALFDAITAGADATAAPAAFAVPVALDAATVQAGSTITAPTFSIPVAIDAVAIAANGNATATPTEFVIPVTFATATVTGTASATATPSTLPIPVAFDPATVGAGATVTSATITAFVTFDPVSASGGSAATASPSAITVVITLDDTTPTAGSTAIPSALEVVAVLPAVFATGGGAYAPGSIVVVVRPRHRTMTVPPVNRTLIVDPVARISEVPAP